MTHKDNCLRLAAQEFEAKGYNKMYALIKFIEAGNYDAVQTLLNKLRPSTPG